MEKIWKKMKKKRHCLYLGVSAVFKIKIIYKKKSHFSFSSVNLFRHSKTNSSDMPHKSLWAVVLQQNSQWQALFMVHLRILNSVGIWYVLVHVVLNMCTEPVLNRNRYCSTSTGSVPVQYRFSTGSVPIQYIFLKQCGGRSQ